MTLLLVSKACIPLGDQELEVRSNFSLVLDWIWLKRSGQDCTVLNLKGVPIQAFSLVPVQVPVLLCSTAQKRRFVCQEYEKYSVFR